MDNPGLGSDAGPLPAAPPGPSGPSSAPRASRSPSTVVTNPATVTHRPTSGAPPASSGSTPGATTGSKPPARRGSPFDLRRGATSKSLLSIAWTYPVPETPSAPNGTVAAHPLTLEEALAFIAGDDPRPLLVLRECERCRGTDHALLIGDLDNEQTKLLTQWFHCVKLPPNVLEERHPLRVLFRPEHQGEWIPHLFLCDRDGSNRTAMSGGQSQTEVWAAMYAQLERNYDTDARKVVKDLRVMLSRFDELDAREKQCRQRLAAEEEKNGAATEKAQRCVAELTAVQSERRVLLAKEKALRTLAPKPAVAPPPAAEAGR